jgi:hypothetical protein
MDKMGVRPLGLQCRLEQFKFVCSHRCLRVGHVWSGACWCFRTGASRLSHSVLGLLDSVAGLTFAPVSRGLVLHQLFHIFVRPESHPDTSHNLCVRRWDSFVPNPALQRSAVYFQYSCSLRNRVICHIQNAAWCGICQVKKLNLEKTLSHASTRTQSNPLSLQVSIQPGRLCERAHRLGTG